MKKICRKELAKRICDKMNNSIEYKVIYECIDLITESIKKDLLNNEIVTIDGFGTFSPYIKLGKNHLDVNDRIVKKLNDKKMVKFIMHYDFKKLLKNNLEKIKKSINK